MANLKYTHPPRRYFAIHYLLLRYLGLGWWHHPDQNDSRNFQGLYLYYSIITELVWVVGFVGLETIDPFVGDKDVDRFMFSLSFVITHDLTIIKLYIMFFKNKEIQDIVRTLEIDLQQFYQNNDKNRKTIRISRILIGVFSFFGWITIANSNIYGIIQDHYWKADLGTVNYSLSLPPRTLPLPIYIPWKYETSQSYITTFVLESVGLVWTGHIVITIDTFISSVILHMSCQFSILHEAFLTAYDRTLAKLMKNIEDDRSLENYDLSKCDNYEEIVKSYYTEDQIGIAFENTLNSCCRQHQVLISCVQKFGDTYSYGFMTQLLSSMTAICVVMVQVSQDVSSFKSIKLITSLAFFVAMVMQLAMQCFTANELTHQASRITEAVMNCKWERMPPRLRRSLVLVMVRAQRPLRLTAGGFAFMSNDCFLSILKAAYSYYAVLSQKQS